jgi:hypothetical protein
MERHPRPSVTHRRAHTGGLQSLSATRDVDADGRAAGGGQAEAGQKPAGQADVVVVDPLDADLVEQLQ